MAILVDWVKQQTATTGTGTITLGSAVSGFIRFQDDTRLSDGSQVYYTIEDGTSRERGIGTYTALGTTLSRDVIHATLVSGTYTENPGSGLNLSGSAVVSCSAIAATHNARGALVYRTSNYAISASTSTPIPWEASVYDTDGFFNAGSNPERLTIPDDVSFVRFKAALYSTAPCDSFTNEIRKNGAPFSGGSGIRIPTSGTMTFVISSVIPVVSGDYFTANAYTTSSGISMSSASHVTNFSVEVVE